MNASRLEAALFTAAELLLCAFWFGALLVMMANGNG